MDTKENSVPGKVNSHYKGLHANMASALQEKPGDRVDKPKPARRKAARDEFKEAMRNHFLEGFAVHCKYFGFFSK